MSPSKELRKMPEGKKFVLTVVASCCASLLAAGLLFFLALPVKLNDVASGLRQNTATLVELRDEVKKIVALDLQLAQVIRDQAAMDEDLAEFRSAIEETRRDIAVMKGNRFTASDGHDLEIRIQDKLDHLTGAIHAFEARLPRSFPPPETLVELAAIKKAVAELQTLHRADGDHIKGR